MSSLLSSFPKKLFRKYLENNSVQNIDTSLEITSKSANISNNIETCYLSDNACNFGLFSSVTFLK